MSCKKYVYLTIYGGRHQSFWTTIVILAQGTDLTVSFLFNPFHYAAFYLTESALFATIKSVFRDRNLYQPGSVYREYLYQPVPINYKMEKSILVVSI